MEAKACGEGLQHYTRVFTTGRTYLSNVEAPVTKRTPAPHIYSREDISGPPECSRDICGTANVVLSPPIIGEDAV